MSSYTTHRSTSGREGGSKFEKTGAAPRGTSVSKTTANNNNLKVMHRWLGLAHAVRRFLTMFLLPQHDGYSVFRLFFERCPEMKNWLSYGLGRSTRWTHSGDQLWDFLNVRQASVTKKKTKKIV